MVKFRWWSCNGMTQAQKILQGEAKEFLSPILGDVFMKCEWTQPGPGKPGCLWCLYLGNSWLIQLRVDICRYVKPSSREMHEIDEIWQNSGGIIKKSSIVQSGDHDHHTFLRLAYLSVASIRGVKRVWVSDTNGNKRDPSSRAPSHTC